MKLFATAVLLSLASLSSLSSLSYAQSAQNQQAIDAAKAAADKWLALVDAGQYKASWEAAATPLRNAVSLAQFEQGGRAVRMPVGAVQQRTLASSKYTTTMAGAPPGQYVVLEYATRFADRANAVETVTPMLDADGTWRVSGYFLK